MSDYPLPSYAANIWLAGDTIWLGFPPIAEGGRAHSVPFPATEKGCLLILEILRQRRAGERLIAEKGSPTRYQVERALVNDRRYNEFIRQIENEKKAAKEEIEEASLFLEELGL